MAITVNGAILRNMPEQISKNVEDIADLQTASTDHESRISDLENDIISSITFNNMNTTGNTVLGDAAADSTTIHGTLQHTDGNAEFGGNVEIDGTLTVNSAADLNNDLDVAGDASVSGALSVTSNATVGGNLIVAGAIKSMEKIVDSDGNNRFIQGDVTPMNIIDENDVQYAKWTLSGSHLMIVLAIITSQDVTALGSHTATLIIPSWLGQKIHGMENTFHVTLIDGLYGFAPSDLAKSANNVRPYLVKYSNTQLDIYTQQGTFNAGYCYRIQFDLVIG